MDLTHIKEQAKACLGNYYGISVLAAFLPMAIISAVQTFPFVGTVAAVFLLPLFIGGARIFLSNYRKRDTSMGLLFDNFQGEVYMQSVGFMFLRIVFIFL